MKNWKRLLALLLAGTMALSLAACNAGGSETSPSPEPSAEASAGPDAGPDASPEIVADLTQRPLEFAAGLSPDEILLTVNGDQIRADLFCYLLAQSCMQMQSYLPYFGMTLSDAADSIMEQTVYMATYHTLMRQKAAELGCLLTDAQTEEIRQALEETDPDIADRYWDLGGGSLEFIFAMNSYYDNVLAAATHEPTGAQLEDYLAGKGVFSVKHILLKTTDDQNQPLPDGDAAAKKTQAEDLLAQLQAAEDMPAKFDELMNEYSEDGRTEDGALGAPDGYVFSSDDSLVGGFREAALELVPGQLSGIVETDYGYHIMLRLPLTDEDKEPYREQYRPDALDALVEQWEQEADVGKAPALDSLDIGSFYDRLAAYHTALAAQDEPAGSEAAG